MPIVQPVGVVRLNADGSINASGWLDNNKALRSLWGAVLQGVPATWPANPWDSDVPVSVAGTFIYNAQTSRYEWQVLNIPGARGNCLQDSFVVWYAYEDESCLDKEASLFVGDSTGTGCSGSGSGSGSGGGGGGGAFPMNALLDGLAPRYYRVTPMNNLGTDLGARVAPPEHSPSNGAVLLQYDELGSTPCTKSWRSVPSMEAAAHWYLRVSAEGAMLRRDDPPRGGRPVVRLDLWRSLSFKFMEANSLPVHNSTTKDSGDRLTNMCVEPLV